MTSLFNVEGGLPAVVRLSFDGPALWVGETALTETVLILVTIGLILLWARWRGLAGLDEGFRRLGRRGRRRQPTTNAEPTDRPRIEPTTAPGEYRG